MNSSATAVMPKTSYGLRTNALSPLETLAQSVANIAPTATPTLVIPVVFGLSGQGSWLAFLLATVAVLLVALNINQFARNSASPGSLYNYVATHMHPFVGMVAGWALLIAYTGTAAAISGGFTNYTNVILKQFVGFEVSTVLLTAIGMAGASWLAYCDVKLSARLMLVLESISVGLIAVVIALTLIQHGPHIDASQLTLRGVTPENLRLGLVMAVFAFVGFESATSLGSEAQNPLKSIPRAVLWSALLAGLFFVLCAYAEVLGFKGETQHLDQNLAPLHLLASKAGLPPALGTIIDIGAVISFFSCILACITAAARILLLMARHKTLPSLFAKAHASNQTPHRAVLVSGIISFLPAGALTFRGVNGFDVNGWVGTLATYGFVTAYLLICLAVPVYLRSRRKLTFGAGALSALASIAMLIVLFGSLYPVPAAPYSWLPYIYLGLLLAGVVWFIVLHFFYPHNVAAMRADLDAAHDEWTLEQQISDPVL